MSRVLDGGDSSLRQSLTFINGQNNNNKDDTDLAEAFGTSSSSSIQQPLTDLTMPAEAASRQRRPQVLEIQPSPGICYKSRDTNGGKVFVNLCSSADIPAPEKLSAAQLQQAMTDGSMEQLRVPLSLGEPHNELDKSGHSCLAYDVIIHPSFLRQIRGGDSGGGEEIFQTFIALVLIDAIKSKFGVQLVGESWLALKNKRYLGTMPRHMIRGRDLPLVQEFSGIGQVPADSPREADHRLDSCAVQEVATTRSPSVHVEQLKSGPQQNKTVALVASVCVPAAAASDLRVECDVTRLLVHSSVARVLCDVTLPCRVMPDRTTVGMCDVSGRVMAVMIPAPPTVVV